MNVLVTGSTGFLGARVVHALVEAGHTVTALRRRTSKLDRLKNIAVHDAIGDVTDRESVRAAMAGQNAVIHTAGDTSYYLGDRARLERVNVDGARIVAEEARAAGVKRFVHTSSVAAIGMTQDGSAADEDCPFWWPIDIPYMDTKRRGESAVREILRGGPHVVILCPATILGPGGMNAPEEQLVLDVKNNKLPLAPPGGYSVCDVDDVALAHVAALERGDDGARYIVAGHDVSYLDLCARFAEKLGVAPPTRTAPSWLLRLASSLVAPLERLGLRSSMGYVALGLSPYRVFHKSDRATLDLGYRARPLDDIIARAAAPYR